MVPASPRIGALAPAALLLLAAAAGAALALDWLPLLPTLGAPVLLAGLAAYLALRHRIQPGLRGPWLAVVLAAGAGAADVVGVGLWILVASLVVGLLLALGQATDRHLAS